MKTKSFEDLNDSREVALEEPIHPEIADQDNPAPQNIPDNHFIVEEPEIESRNPCSLCIILWNPKGNLIFISFESLNDSQEVKLKEPIQPKTSVEDNFASQNIPNTH